MIIRGLIFHRLVRKGLRTVVAYYRDNAGQEVADAFVQEFVAKSKDAQQNPQRYSKFNGDSRRVNLIRFPYHFLFRELDDSIQVLVLRHHHRNPEFGLDRK